MSDIYRDATFTARKMKELCKGSPISCAEIISKEYCEKKYPLNNDEKEMCKFASKSELSKK